MKDARPESDACPMPLAMAALDVAGQLRERSPADRAIFGDEARRLAERFVEAGSGQALLARAVAEGSAEAVVALRTPAGPQPFRVALWRQRGGERVRVLAVFAAVGAGDASDAATAAPGLPDTARAALARIGGDLRGPLAAVIGLADRLRTGGQRSGRAATAALASDILAAGWRLTRLAEEIRAMGRSGTLEPEPSPSEVDLARLVRRLMRLAAPGAESTGVTLDEQALPRPGRGPAVLADERCLWSIIERLLATAIARAGSGGRVAAELKTQGKRGGLALEITGTDPIAGVREMAEAGSRTGDEGGLDICVRLAGKMGARLEFDPGPGFGARLVFSPARCLDPL